MADVQGQAFLQELTASLADANHKVGPVKDEKPVILVTTVDIGGGRSDRIEFRKGDEPTDAAKAFCKKHNLPATIVGPLTHHILDHLRKAAITPDGKSLNTAQSDGFAPPASAESPVHANSSINSKAPANGKGGKQFSFSSGMDDPKLFEQLSNKLLPVDESRHDMRNVVTASEYMQSSDNSSRMRSSGSHNGLRKPSMSAGPSPRMRESTVYNRLYGVAFDKQARLECRRREKEADEQAQLVSSRASMSWISSEMMKGRTSGLYENYGEMLYAEGVESHLMKQRRLEMERAERAAKELEGATFAPVITAKAQELKAREASVPDKDSSEKWARMHARGMRKATLERLEDIRRAREAEEVKECTFKPRINNCSDHMMAERSETLKVLNISHHDQLFQDALRRQQKMSELANWFPDEVTFQPAVNKDARAREYLRRSWDKVMRDSPRADGGAAANTSSFSVVERLYAQLEKKNAKLEEARQRLNGPLDPNTGKQLYKPETGRAPKNMERNPDGRPIGEYLYQNAVDMEARKRAQEDEERRAAEEEARRARTSAQSENIFLRLKLKRFVQIFEYLDEAGVGVIDLVGLVRGRGPRVERLDGEVLLDVETAAGVWARAHGVPLEPSEDGTTADCPPLDQKEFLSVMEQALQQRRAPRAYLVPSPSAKSAPSHSFKPAINARSKEIAARLRSSDAPVHEVLHQSHMALKEKLEARRKQNEDAELKDCTFAPRLNASSRAVEGRALRAGRVMAEAMARAARAGGSAGSIHAAGNAAGMECGLTPQDAAAMTMHILSNGGAPPVSESQALAGLGVSASQLDSEESRQLEEFSLLEQELSEMMAATTLAKERLSALSTPEQQQQLQAGEVSSGDAASMAAMEELLLQQLAASDASAEAEAMLASMVQQQAGSRRTTKDVAGGQTVSMFVVPTGVAGANGGMQALASELESGQWE